MTSTAIDETSLARPLRLRDERGGAVGGDWRWLGAAALEHEQLLDRAVGPVLDVGCGPGRHPLALARRGVEATGIDVTPAVRVARSRGASVVEGSIFGPVPAPAPGTWATAKAGLTLTKPWCGGGRRFAQLDLCAPRRR